MERRPEAISQTAAHKQQRTSKPTEEINLTQKIQELKEKINFNALDISTLTNISSKNAWTSKQEVLHG